MQIASSTVAPAIDHPTQPQSSQLISASLPPLSASATPQVPLPVTPPSPQPLPQAPVQPSPYNTAPPLTPPRPTQPCPPQLAVPRRLLKDPTCSSTHGGPTALGMHLKASRRRFATARSQSAPYRVFSSQPSPCPPHPSSQPSLPSTQHPSSTAPVHPHSSRISNNKSAPSWLPVEYLQSPLVPLTNNTRHQRAKRLQARLHIQSGPKDSGTAPPTSSLSVSPTNGSSRPARRRGRPPKLGTQ